MINESPTSNAAVEEHDEPAGLPYYFIFGRLQWPGETVADIVVNTLAAVGLRNVYCEVVSIPAQVPRVLDMAIQTAIFRQGVSVIVLPEDVALQGRFRLATAEPGEANRIYRQPRYGRVALTRRRPFDHRSIASELPQAIGARSAFRFRHVIALQCATSAGSRSLWGISLHWPKGAYL